MQVSLKCGFFVEEKKIVRVIVAQIRAFTRDPRVYLATLSFIGLQNAYNCTCLHFRIDPSHEDESLSFTGSVTSGLLLRPITSAIKTVCRLKGELIIGLYLPRLLAFPLDASFRKDSPDGFPSPYICTFFGPISKRVEAKRDFHRFR